MDTVENSNEKLEYGVLYDQNKVKMSNVFIGFKFYSHNQAFEHPPSIYAFQSVYSNKIIFIANVHIIYGGDDPIRNPFEIVYGLREIDLYILKYATEQKYTNPKILIAGDFNFALNSGKKN